jgi:hypothetical protein
MSKNTAKDLEDLDVKTESSFMKWLKRVAYVVTILTTLSGGILGILSYLREVKDPRAQAGYDVHSRMLKENSENIRENRSEIRFIYKAMIAKEVADKSEDKTNKPPKIEDRAKKLPDAPIQRPLDWKKLPVEQRAGD